MITLTSNYCIQINTVMNHSATFFFHPETETERNFWRWNETKTETKSISFRHPGCNQIKESTFRSFLPPLTPRARGKLGREWREGARRCEAPPKSAGAIFFFIFFSLTSGRNHVVCGATSGRLACPCRAEERSPLHCVSRVLENCASVC